MRSLAAAPYSLLEELSYDRTVISRSRMKTRSSKGQFKAPSNSDVGRSAVRLAGSSVFTVFPRNVLDCYALTWPLAPFDQSYAYKQLKLQRKTKILFCLRFLHACMRAYSLAAVL